MERSRTRTLLLSLLIVLAIAQWSRAEVNYQTTLPAGGTVNLTGNAIEELGDQVTLGGTSRTLTAADTRITYYGAGQVSPYTVSLYMHLYQDANHDELPDGPAFATAYSLGPTLEPASGTADYDLTFAFANVVVPDTFIFAIGQTDALSGNPDANYVALKLDANPNAIGSSTDNVSYLYDGQWYAESLGAATSNVRMTLTTPAAEVPEPSSFVLAGLGVLGLLLAARRRMLQAAAVNLRLSIAGLYEAGAFVCRRRRESVRAAASRTSSQPRPGRSYSAAGGSPPKTAASRNVVEPRKGRKKVLPPLPGLTTRPGGTFRRAAARR